MAKAPQAQAEVVNHGDVTERVYSPLAGEMIPLQPMSALPESHEHLAKVYPMAQGFAVEPNGNISFHF